MKIKITVQELVDRGCFLEAFEMLGINEWALNEGQIDYSEELELTAKQARELGLIPETQAERWDAEEKW